MRLTDRVGIDYIYGNFVSLKEPHKRIANKLGQLEDIEEELGIDLVTLFKASNNGFYYKLNDNIMFIEQGYEFNLRGGYIHLGCSINPLKVKIKNIMDRILPFSDYGKTWALTKEELL